MVAVGRNFVPALRRFGELYPWLRHKRPDLPRRELLRRAWIIAKFWGAADVVERLAAEQADGDRRRRLLRLAALLRRVRDGKLRTLGLRLLTE